MLLDPPARHPVGVLPRVSLFGQRGVYIPEAELSSFGVSVA
jgi:hypothetical protein